MWRRSWSPCIDVMLPKYLLQRFAEGGVVGEGDGEIVVRRLSGGGLSSEGVEEFASNFVHDGSCLLRGESVEEAHVTDGLEF